MTHRDFYMGWQPKMPRALRPVMLGAALFLVSFAGTMAMLIAYNQSAVGPARWNTDQTVTIEGIMQANPYPLLLVPGEQPRSVLLVQAGKISALPVVDALVGRRVRGQGFLITRGGFEMLEVIDESAFEDQGPADLTLVPATQDLGSVTLVGEVMDSKCFLGTMKPGEGKVHRACASLCLKGGIPPLLAAKDRAGNRAGYLLMSRGDQSLAAPLAPLAAMPVSLTGQLVRRGDLLFIRTSPVHIAMLRGAERLAYGPTIAEDAGIFCAPEIG